jgi:Tol biopolymer transport system component/DNA-binding winged helix-turn-helix (wHTH) protein
MRVFKFADFLLDESEGVLYRANLPVQLAPKVFETLLVLVKNQGRVVSKDELMKEVWSDTFVEENNLTQYIFILRKILGESDTQKFIETVPRRGYRFLPETVVSEKPSARALAEKDKVSFPNNTRQNPQSRFVLLLIALGLIVFLSVSFFLRRSGGEKVWAANEIKIKRLTENGRIYGADISPDGNSYAYILRDGKNFSLRLKNIQTESEIVLVTLDEGDLGVPRFSPDGNFICYARGSSKSEIFQIPVYGGESRKIAENLQSEYSFSPDGRQIAYPRIIPSQKKHQIVVANTDGSGERVVAERVAPLFYHLWGPAPAWIDGGEKLIVSAGSADAARSSLVEINIADGSEREVKTSQPFYFIGFVKPLNAEELMISAMPERQSKQQLFRVDLTSGEVSPVTNDLSDYATISLSKKADKLLTLQTTSNFHLWLYDAETGAARQLTFGENRHDGLIGLNFASDGKILYASREVAETNIFELNPETNETKQLTRRTGRNFEPAVSPDGEKIVFVSDRTGFGHIWIMNRDGSDARQLNTSPDDKKVHELEPAFSPDGRSVYYLYYPYPFGKVYKIPVDGGESVLVTPEDKNLFLPDVSPDGKFLAVGDNVSDKGAKIGVFSLADPREEEKIFDFPAYRTYSRWMPDSQTLVTINGGGEGNNLALHNILTGEAKQLTDFNVERIERFAVSPDGKKFVIARGNWATDAVLIEH